MSNESTSSFFGRSRKSVALFFRFFFFDGRKANLKIFATTQCTKEFHSQSSGNTARFILSYSANLCMCTRQQMPRRCESRSLTTIIVHYEMIKSDFRQFCNYKIVRFRLTKNNFFFLLRRVMEARFGYEEIRASTCDQLRHTVTYNQSPEQGDEKIRETSHPGICSRSQQGSKT